MGYEAGNRTDDVFQEQDLKVCELCGGLNLADNGECFLCGWRGQFERRPEVVRVAMDLARRHYGSLKAQFLTDPQTIRRTAVLGVRSRASRFFAAIHHWLFG